MLHAWSRLRPTGGKRIINGPRKFRTYDEEYDYDDDEYDDSDDDDDLFDEEEIRSIAMIGSRSPEAKERIVAELNGYIRTMPRIGPMIKEVMAELGL